VCQPGRIKDAEKNSKGVCVCRCVCVCVCVCVGWLHVFKSWLMKGKIASLLFFFFYPLIHLQGLGQILSDNVCNQSHAFARPLLRRFWCVCVCV